MDYSPPSFFKRGPSALSRLTLAVAVSALLIATDARLRYLDVVRSAVSVVLYPLQRLATAPGVLATKVGDYFASQTRLTAENARFRQDQSDLRVQVQRLAALEAENRHLRRLLDAREQHEQKAIAAEILYAERNPFSRRILIDRGSNDAIEPGQVVIDDSGVVGQITRVHPLLSEVTLVTDKDHAVPVQVVRNGLRTIVFGAEDGSLELRFLPVAADVEKGDLLVTSGIDSVYPAGLPVAVVSRIERDASRSFAQVHCQPVAGPERHRQVLVLERAEPAPERPAPEPPPTGASGRKRGR
jgi:rod shape-determining protein MreC